MKEKSILIMTSECEALGAKFRTVFRRVIVKSDTEHRGLLMSHGELDS